jgi:hypothetical protein
MWQPHNMTPTRQHLSRPDYVELWKALDPGLQNYLHDDGYLHHPLIVEPIVDAKLIPYTNDSYRKRKAHRTHPGYVEQTRPNPRHPYQQRPITAVQQHVQDRKHRPG